MINLIERGESYLIFETNSHDHGFLNIINFFERYEMKIENIKVKDYRELIVEIHVNGFGEDIQLFVDEYELA